MVTIRDVAKEAGLSTGTISNALTTPNRVSEKNLVKVKQAIEKLDYKPNMLSQKFRNKQSNTIVVLVRDISNPFFARVITGIELVAQRAGFSVVLGDTRNSPKREQEFINMVETNLADGIINLGPLNERTKLPANGVTSVSPNSKEGTLYPSIRIDNIGASAQVVEYLIGLGHRRIGVISGPFSNPYTADRLTGYKQALANASITFDANLIAEGDFSYASGFEAARQLIQLDSPPTAVFCMNDGMAMGATKGFSEAGLEVPGDVSITGFDNMDVSQYCRPTLTSVSQPAEQMGEKSAELLLQLIAGKAPRQTAYVLPHKLLIRESTQPPKTDKF